MNLPPHATLLGYNLNLPSYRYRMQSLVAPLAAAGWTVQTETFPSGRYGIRTYERRALLRRSDVTVLHQIKLSAAEAWLLSAYAHRMVFDFDDAIYVRKPRQLGEPAGDSRWRRMKFASTCNVVDVVAAGNDVLRRAAEPIARRIEVLPTALDLARYRASHATAEDPPTIAWIGNPENLIYLEIMRPALVRLTLRYPKLRLRVICSRFPNWPGLNIDPVIWSPAVEVEALAGSHIGVMPLTDDEWSRGKCAFKLLQYMAASLPCVASPIGANTEAVIDGVTGFHAPDSDAWESALGRLIESPPLRARLGAAGRQRVEERYAVAAYQARYVRLLEELRRG